jgi:release factor glutamine methyltransferase
LVRRLERALAGAGIENAAAEARWLMEAAAGRTYVELLTEGELDAESVTRAEELMRRRAAGEPLQYVTGVAGFRHLELLVGPGVFIPRPETELLVDDVLSVLPPKGIAIDVGTGSGAIALAIAQERPDARVIATESSSEAFEFASKNRRRTGVEIEIVIGDIFSGVSEDVRGAVDVVVSNPPYVALSEKEVVAPDVLAHEPHEAVFAEDAGMEVVERLVAESPEWLRPGGWIAFEIGTSQLGIVEDVLRGNGFEDVEVRHDLAGRARIARGRRP